MTAVILTSGGLVHGDVIKWKHFPRYWPLCGEFTGHQWNPRTGANVAELWCFLWFEPWINGLVSNDETGDLRRHRAHYDATVMVFWHMYALFSLDVLTHLARVPHIYIVDMDHRWFRWWRVACSASGHRLNQWWLLINQIPRNTFN